MAHQTNSRSEYPNDPAPLSPPHKRQLFLSHSLGNASVFIQKAGWILVLFLSASFPIRSEDVISFQHRPYRVEADGTRAVPGKTVSLSELLTSPKWLSARERTALLKTLGRFPQLLNLPANYPAGRMWSAAFSPFIQHAEESGVEALNDPAWIDRLSSFPSFNLRFFLFLRKHQFTDRTDLPFPSARSFRVPFPLPEPIERPKYRSIAHVRDVTPSEWSKPRRLLQGDLIEDSLFAPKNISLLAQSVALSQRLEALVRNPRPQLLSSQEREAWAQIGAKTHWLSSTVLVGPQSIPAHSLREFSAAIMDLGWKIEIEDVRKFANLADLTFIDDQGIRHDVATPLWIETGITLPQSSPRKDLRIPMPHTHLTFRFLDPSNRCRAQVLYYYGWWGGPTFLPDIQHSQSWIGNRTPRIYRSRDQVLLIASALDTYTFHVGFVVRRLGGSNERFGHGNLGTCLRPSAIVERMLHPENATTFYPLTANPALDEYTGNRSPLARAIRKIRRIGDDVLRSSQLTESLKKRIGASLPVNRVTDLEFLNLAQDLRAAEIHPPGETDR